MHTTSKTKLKCNNIIFISPSIKKKISSGGNLAKYFPQTVWRNHQSFTCLAISECLFLDDFKEYLLQLFVMLCPGVINSGLNLHRGNKLLFLSHVPF